MIYDKVWYKNLIKPKFQPSERVFPIAWAILYLTIIISFFIILFCQMSLLKVFAIAFFSIQLGLNFSWTNVFFVRKNLKKSFELTWILLFFVVITAILFYNASLIAGIIFTPYVIWCGFAVYLMHNIYKLNG